MGILVQKSTDALVRLLRRLIIARGTFEEIRSACESLERQPANEDAALQRVAFCGICAGYVRPFLRGDGLGPLSSRYSVFGNADQARLHADLINGRHWLFAHRDAVNASKLVDPLGGLQIGQVDIVLEPGKGARFLSVIPVLQRDRLQAIAALCATQQKRIEEEIGETVRLLTQGKRFKPGRYRLGETFP